MKRTTYIMIGMLVTGVAMVCGLMFYVVDRNVTQKDNFMEIRRRTENGAAALVQGVEADTASGGVETEKRRYCGGGAYILVRGSAVGGDCRLFAAGQFLLCRGYGGFYVDDFRWRYPARHL